MDSLACVIHAKGDLRLETQSVGEPGAGQVRVRIGAGGICGSDLHYFNAGGFGTVRLREPMVLGHEVAGTIDAVGPDVNSVRVGDRVALNPARACGVCRFCRAGAPRHCVDMKFYGSAMPWPHSQGAFRTLLLAEARQCEPLAASVSFAEGACAEPLAVALHAVAQAGELHGSRVLVTGAGPIGLMVIAAARWAGAAEIVAVDLHAPALEKALAMGAARVINAATEAEALGRDYAADKGLFDVAFECSGAPGIFRDIAPVLRPRGVLVQLGMGGELAVPANLLVGKEIRWQGAFRFDSEYALAVRLLNEGAIDVRPMITASFPLERAVEAFGVASQRTVQSKVQIVFP